MSVFYILFIEDNIDNWLSFIPRIGTGIANELKTFIEEIDSKQNDHDEFHDAVDNEHDSSTEALEGEFEDALTLHEDEEATLTEEEKLERKIKSDALKNDGNTEFKVPNYDKAIELYSEALNICPKSFKTERSILYGNRAAAYIQKELKELAIDDCTKSLEANDTYLKALVRRAKLYEETDKLDESLADYNRIVELDASNGEARAAIPRLNQKIEVRNEKLKEEMLGKLKDLGNMILRPFGLSTANFQMQQDPNTGSYSVNFSQNSGNS